MKSIMIALGQKHGDMPSPMEADDVYYPHVYIESDKDPKIEVGADVPATLHIKEVKTRETSDGKIVYCLEAEVHEIQGKSAAEKPASKESDLDAIDSGLSDAEKAKDEPDDEGDDEDDNEKEGE